MTIDAIEDGSEVRQPDRRIGKIRVTRRERKLISDGKDINVEVCGSDGLCRRFLFSQLEEIHYKEPEESEVEYLRRELSELKERVIANTECVCGDLNCHECPR